MNDWTNSPPNEEGFWLMMTSAGQVQLRRVWIDAGRLVMWWEGRISPVESIQHRIGWYWWYNTRAIAAPSYGALLNPENSVAERNYE